MRLLLILAINVILSTQAYSQYLINSPKQIRPTQPQKNNQSQRMQRIDEDFYQLSTDTKASEASKRQKLLQITTQCQNMSEGFRQNSLAKAIYLWRRWESKSWLNPPIRMSVFRDLQDFNAILERQAEELNRQGKLDQALKIYDTLAAIYADRSEAVGFELKCLEIERARYIKSSEPLRYEKRLSRLSDRYRQSDEKTFAKVDGLRQQFLAREIARSKSPKLATQTVARIDRYIQSIDDTALKERYLASSARLFVAVSLHKKAVDIYMDLALNGTESNRITHLNSAIAAQHVVAKWPNDPPWLIKLPPKNNEQATLRDMYKTLYERQADLLPWKQRSQLGLLLISTGNRDEAFELWTKALTVRIERRESSFAIGYMFRSYSNQKNWERLEELARIGLKVSLDGTVSKAVLRSTEMLADALINGGKQLLERKDYKQAIAKLKEFCDSYTRDTRRDEGLFHLAIAYHHHGQHKNSIEISQELVKQYRTSRFREPALYNGGQWSVALALEEMTIFFFQTLVNDYPKSTKVPVVREQLIELYLGREIYANAIDLLEQIAFQKNSSTKLRNEAALRLLDVTDRYANTNEALRVAASIQKSAGNDSTAIARAIRVEARYYAAQQDYKRVARLESSLAKLQPLSLEAQDYLGEIRFLLANSYVPSEETEILSPELKDPLKTINEEFARYAQIKRAYLNVCQAGTTSFCAPAHIQIAINADRVYQRIEPVEIPPSLATNVVKTFSNRHDQIINQLADDQLQATSEAASTMKQTRTNPDWTTQILWENSTDWNFERITGEAGNGFVQFDPVAK
jgi:hypothetical protein